MRVEINNEWEKVEDKIKEIDDNFSFTEGEAVQIQNVGNCNILVCEEENEPTEETAGYVLQPLKFVEYTKEEGKNLYMKGFNSTGKINF